MCVRTSHLGRKRPNEASLQPLSPPSNLEIHSRNQGPVLRTRGLSVAARTTVRAGTNRNCPSSFCLHSNPSSDSFLCLNPPNRQPRRRHEPQSWIVPKRLHPQLHPFSRPSCVCLPVLDLRNNSRLDPGEREQTSPRVQRSVQTNRKGKAKKNRKGRAE